MEKTITICGLPIPETGPRKGEFGVCEKVPGHTRSRGGFRNCSNDAVRKYQRDHTAKTRAKAKKLKETPASVDDSILDDDIDDLCACGHTLDSCPNPKYCGLSPTQIEERQKREAEEAAYQAQQEAARVRKAEEERFLSEVLSRHEAGEAIDHQTQASFLATVISYLGLPAKFSLDAGERIHRALDVESRLSEVLYGPSYTMLNEPPSRLDEKSFKVRLGHFLNVADLHGWRNVAHRYHPSRKVPAIPPPQELP